MQLLPTEGRTRPCLSRTRSAKAHRQTPQRKPTSREGHECAGASDRLVDIEVSSIKSKRLSRGGKKEDNEKMADEEEGPETIWETTCGRGDRT